VTAQLHPQYETMFLLCNTPWGGEQREEAIAELGKMGFEGEVFYQQHCQFVEQYYHVFEKSCISSRGTEILRDMDIALLNVCAGVFGQHPDWFETMDDISEQDAGEAVIEVIVEEADAGADFIGVLESEDLPDESKWKIIFFQRYAKQQLAEITAAVKENIPAYEKAVNKVSEKLNILLRQYDGNMKKTEKSRLFKVPDKLTPGGEIFPTLAFPMTIFLNPSVGFYGLLTETLAVGGESEFSREELLIGAKALSDRSKMEILMCLKDKQLYNYEIAECVGLTAATVSHHMNMLLTAGFVDLGKEGGRGYYTLNRSGIEHYLQGVRRLFLNEK